VQAFCHASVAEQIGKTNGFAIIGTGSRDVRKSRAALGGLPKRIERAYEASMREPRRPLSRSTFQLPGLRREIVLAILLTASAVGFSLAALVSSWQNGPVPAEHAPLR
jgi:hypothetical protein